METIKEEKKADLKLRELKRGTKVKMIGGGFVGEFLGVDGMYCRWNLRDKNGVEEITIMGHANQKVSEYGEIID